MDTAEITLETLLARAQSAEGEDLTSLPTLGGEAPSEASVRAAGYQAAWSWDRTRLLLTDCDGRWLIADRAEIEGPYGLVYGEDGANFPDVAERGPFASPDEAVAAIDDSMVARYGPAALVAGWVESDGEDISTGAGVVGGRPPLLDRPQPDPGGPVVGGEQLRLFSAKPRGASTAKKPAPAAVCRRCHVNDTLRGGLCADCLD